MNTGGGEDAEAGRAPAILLRFPNILRDDDTAMPRRDIWPWLAGSLVLASASAFGPFLIPVIDIGQSLILSGVWLVLFLIVLALKKKQGLWLLIGAPLAAYVPAIAVAIVSACSQNIKSCP